MVLPSLGLIACRSSGSSSLAELEEDVADLRQRFCE